MIHVKHSVQYLTRIYELNTWKLSYNTMIFQTDDQDHFFLLLLFFTELKDTGQDLPFVTSSSVSVSK